MTDYEKGYKQGYKDCIKSVQNHKRVEKSLNKDNEMDIESIFIERKQEGIYVRSSKEILERWNAYKLFVNKVGLQPKRK